MAASTAPASPAAMRCGPAMSAISASAGWQRSDGIDSFGAGRRARRLRQSAPRACRSRRGRPTRSGSASSAIGSKATANMTASIRSPSCAPTRSTRPKNRIARGARLGARAAGAAGRRGAEASYLDSANRNRLAGAPLNSTFGDRLTLGAQVSAPVRRPPAHRRGRASGGGFPRPRHRLFRRHRPGPLAAA